MDQSTFNHGKSGDTNPKGSSRSPLLELYTRSLRNEREEKIGHRTSAACGGRLRLCYKLYDGETAERETTNCPPKRVSSRDGESNIQWQGTALDLPQIAKRKRKSKKESLFFIPAQRVLTLRDGWPRPFTDYSPGDPFAVREFSENLRVLVEREISPENLFPQVRRLKKQFRDLLERDVFSKYALKIDKFRSQKRLVLGTGREGENLPYMVWSAGQREFVPLLLGFYWLMPPTKVSRRSQIEW